MLLWDPQQGPQYEQKPALYLHISETNTIVSILVRYPTSTTNHGLLSSRVLKHVPENVMEVKPEISPQNAANNLGQHILSKYLYIFTAIENDSMYLYPHKKWFEFKLYNCK